MGNTSLSALLPPLRILILGYGHVTQAFLPLLASRSEWLGRETGIRPVIIGIGSRIQGLYIHPKGLNIESLASEHDPIKWFKSTGTRVENFETVIQAGEEAGASIFIELTTLNPQDGPPYVGDIGYLSPKGAFFRDVRNAWDAISSDHYPEDSKEKRQVEGALRFHLATGWLGDKPHFPIILKDDRQVALLDAMAEAVNIPHQRGQRVIPLPSSIR